VEQVNCIINFNSRDLSAATTNERTLRCIALYTYIVSYNGVYLFIIHRRRYIDENIMCRSPVAARTHTEIIIVVDVIFNIELIMSVSTRSCIDQALLVTWYINIISM